MQFDFEVAYPYIIIAVALIFAIYWITRQPPFNPAPPIKKIQGNFTLEELKKYNGETQQQNFVALKGVIYDVTGSQFYSKDSAYGIFSGSDASINLATMKLEQELLNQWGTVTLTQQQQKTLDQWVQTFEGKYRKVGKVIS